MSLRSLLVLVLIFAGCGRSESEESAIQMTRGGDPRRGRSAVEKYGCGSCHSISGVEGATGRVGPPLDGVRDRLYLAGRIQNTVPNMIQWIQHPHSVDPRTAMPELGLTSAEARDVAAFLYARR